VLAHLVDVLLFLLVNCNCFASGKKHARQFDFMAMFEETRKTAIERSQPVFGKFFIFSSIIGYCIQIFSCFTNVLASSCIFLNEMHGCAYFVNLCVECYS